MNILIIVGAIIGLVEIICLLGTFISEWMKKEKLSDIMCNLVPFLAVLSILFCFVGLLYEAVIQT